MAFWPIGPIFQRSGTVFIRRSFRDNPVYKLRAARVRGPPGREAVQPAVLRRGRALPHRQAPAAQAGPPHLRRRRLPAGTQPTTCCWCPSRSPTTSCTRSVSTPARPGCREVGREHRPGWSGPSGEQRGRFGKIYVRFGEPISLRAALRRSEPGRRGRHLALQKVAFEVSRRINEVTPITATSLVTLASSGRRPGAHRSTRCGPRCTTAGRRAAAGSAADRHVELGTDDGVRRVLQSSSATTWSFATPTGPDRCTRSATTSTWPPRSTATRSSTSSSPAPSPRRPWLGRASRA